MKSHCHRNVIGVVFALAFMQMGLGTASFQTARQPRIIGGSDAASGEIPYQVLLTKDGDFRCGGSILTPVIILTAAHCVIINGTTVNSTQLLVTAGAHDQTYLSSDSSQTLQVRYVYPHENYTNEKGMEHDIALIVLRSPLQFSVHIKNIGLPSANEEFEGDLIVSGWGKTQEEGTGSSILKKVEVPIVSNQKCNASYSSELGSQITENILCAGKVGLDACQGDSGGPATCRQNRSNGPPSIVQCGVVSAGQGCSRARFAGIYVKVSKYIGWIEETKKAIFARDNKCRTDHFHCPSTGCMHRTLLCDLKSDCADDDGKDESSCNEIDMPYTSCLSGEFRCNNGGCVHSSARCNLYDDCGDGSDEDKCPNENKSCEVGDYQCGINGRCIPAEWKCDGELDCDDNSDEEICPGSMASQNLVLMNKLAKSKSLTQYRAREKLLALLKWEENSEMRTSAAGAGAYSWTRNQLWENIHDARCKQWFENEPSPPTDTLPCPPTLPQAEQDWRFSKDTTSQFASKEMNPEGHTIYLQNVPSPSGAGSHCSYDKDGDLVIGYPHGSRTHRVSPNSRLASHYWDDVQPYLECCVLSYNKTENCREYYFAKRPSSNILSPYLSPIPFRATGATHVTTLNGATYLLGTLGTFSLLKYKEELEAQVTTEPYKTQKPNYNSTVITSAVIQSMNDNFQSTFSVSAHETNGLLIWLDDEPVNFVKAKQSSKSSSANLDIYSKEIFTIYHEGVTAIINGTSAALFSYSNGISIKMFISAGNKSINIIGSASANIVSSSCTGLVSNFGGNPKNGLNIKTDHAFSSKSSSPLDQSSKEFVEQWKLYNTVKTPSRRYSSSFHFNRDYLMSVAQARNTTICENVQDCQIDFLTTGNEEFAMSSMNAFEQFKTLLNASQMNTVTTTCEKPGPLKNGKYLADNFNLGTSVTPTCDRNYQLHTGIKNSNDNDDTLQENSFICRLHNDDDGDTERTRSNKITSYRATWVSSQLLQPLSNYFVECKSSNKGGVSAHPSVISLLGNQSISLTLHNNQIDTIQKVGVSCVFLNGRTLVETEGTLLKQLEFNDTNPVVICPVPALQILGKINIKLIIKYKESLPLVLEGHVWSQKPSEDSSNWLDLFISYQSNDQVLTLKWNPVTFDGANPISFTRCDLSLIIIQMGEKFWEELSLLHSGICNTGSCSIWTYSLLKNVSSFREIFDKPTAIAVKSTIKSGNDVDGLTESRIVASDLLPSIIVIHEMMSFVEQEISSAIYHHAGISSESENHANLHTVPDFDQLCENWYTNEKNVIPSAHILSCPKSENLVLADWRYFQTESQHIPNLYRPTQYFQYAPSEIGAGIQCTYNQNGTLIDYPVASQIYRYSPNDQENGWWNHYLEDSLPQLYCCQWSKSKKDNCRNYFYQKRGILPTGEDDNNVQSFAHIWGAAHFETFDGFRYRFNGAGEFWLLKDQDNSKGKHFKCQVRLEPYSSAKRAQQPMSQHENDTGSRVSVITAVTMEQNVNGEKITIQVSRDDSPAPQFFVDGELVDSSELRTIYLKGVTVSLGSSIVVVFQNGFACRISSCGVGEPGMNVIISFSPAAVGSNSVTNVTGLLGNMDGDSSNDLETLSGSVLLANSSNEEIHTNFGREWAVHDNDSIFTYYPLGSSYHDFFKPEFKPVKENWLPLSHKLFKFCEKDEECIFDALETGSETFAKASRASEKLFQALLCHSGQKFV